MNQVISSEDLLRVQDAMKKGLAEIAISPDLGISRAIVKIEKDGFILDGKRIALGKIRDKDKSCYLIEDGVLKKLQFFSPETNAVYKLVPTAYRPILQISGTSMHKMEFIAKVQRDKLRGKILDAGTGMGYTAIAASKTADEVTTIEIDENVIAVAKLNPYSQELFTSKNIRMVAGDVTEKILEFPDGSMRAVILDGGTPSASGTFFSLKHYEHVFRVLSRKGRLYHYLPRPQVKKGRDFVSEVATRIRKAGFGLIKKFEEDSYLIATKF